jgi:hypothetical protein
MMCNAFKVIMAMEAGSREYCLVMMEHKKAQTLYQEGLCFFSM